MGDAATFIEHLLRGHSYDRPTEPGDFDVAVNRLVHDGIDRHVAVMLMERAKGRRQNLIAWSDQILRSRAEYRKKLAEVGS